MDYSMKHQSEAAKQDKALCDIGHGSVSHHNAMENRRSANYKPNIWKYDFLQSLTSQYDNEEFVMRLEKMIKEAKSLFVEEIGPLPKLELISTIQNLGLANHFQKEIKEAIETVISVKNNNIRVHDHVYFNAQCFRLLRQNGYEVSPDKLGTIFLYGKENKGNKYSISRNIKGLIELLEVSHLGLESEDILEDVKRFAINSLKDASTKLHYSNQVVHHALELPSHWRVQWFQVKWHIKELEKNHMNHVLLELAKLNFNIIQANLQKEVKELSRWWKNLGLEKELKFARNRLVESFMCAAGVSSEPKFKSLRKWLTKVINFVLVIDDIYDVYASFEELKQFTLAIDRWDAKELQSLPDYMRICFQALSDVTAETAQEIAAPNNVDKVLPYIKQAWKDFCKSLYVEAKWYKEGYVPCLEEYLNNAWISSSGPVILLHAYFATLYQPTHHINNFLLTNHDFIFNVSLIIRLCNDLGTTMAERERGDAASSILCYINHMDVTEETAREHIEEMIKRAWKKINEQCVSTQDASKQAFVNQAMNAARVAHTLYQNGDGFGIQDGDIKKQILSLVIEPFPDV
ncbi:alpha-farnesene synthase-like [Prosopis cineraria]|uniref:alpha-farnesene synthase-like n=1 Tax=Prosopis cineraria TaxID=364024 RepID=UPI0024103859|nr:alpha-farnesene synthase-like [Prosopis cineraria]